MSLISHYLSLAGALAACIPALATASPDWRASVKQRLGPRHMARIRCLVRGKKTPRWGNLRVTEPFSAVAGLDRGGAVNRYYADKFFSQYASLITGRVLEVEHPVYTERFGRNVVQVDTVDIDPRHRPTYLCDLAKTEDVIPGDTYDCFLLPFTLIIVREVEAALRNAYRVLRPGGAMLAVNPMCPTLWGEPPESYWRMPEGGWREVMARAVPEGDCEFRTYGNCLSSVASVLGLAWEELTDAELDLFDKNYPVVVTIACRKPA